MNIIQHRNKIEKIVIDNAIKYKNEHLFYFWDKLNDKQKDDLISEIEKIDFKFLYALFNKIKNENKKRINLEETEYLSIKEKREEYKTIGVEALKSKQIAFLTVAGGQGSRLDFNLPKGCFPASPVKKKSLFQIFAEKLKFYSSYYKNNFNWFIMTSVDNNQDIIDYFIKNNYFDLKKENIYFFNQGIIPSLTMDGKLFLSDKSNIFMNPDGHGGIIKALIKSGLLEKIKKGKIKYLSYFQVDNPLVNMADPYFIGYHIKQKSMISSKVIKKLYPEEKLGIIGKIKGKNRIIEYSDLSKDDMYSKREDGELKYNMGSIAIHIFNVDFLKSINNRIPIHYAKKKIKGYIFNNDKNPEFAEMEGIKFETFVFDAIPLAKRSIFFETGREVEFFPIKNKSGIDSIETSIIGQSKLFFIWLKCAGIFNEEYKNQLIEISPLYAPEKDFFLEKAYKDSDKLKKAVFNKNGKIREKIYIE